MCDLLEKGTGLPQSPGMTVYLLTMSMLWPSTDTLLAGGASRGLVFEGGNATEGISTLKMRLAPCIETSAMY